MTPTEYMALITGVLGAVVAFYTALNNTRKAETESLRESLTYLSNEAEKMQHRMTEIQAEASNYMEERNKLRERIRTLENELVTLRTRIEYLECENKDYRALLLQVGLTEDQIDRGGCTDTFTKLFPQAKTTHNPQD